jgi:hypothetical protein
MRDPILARLLTILDALPAAAAVPDGAVAAADLADAAQRTAAARRLLGTTPVQESPYLAFARRLVPQQQDAAVVLAASA